MHPPYISQGHHYGHNGFHPCKVRQWKPGCILTVVVALPSPRQESPPDARIIRGDGDPHRLQTPGGHPTAPPRPRDSSRELSLRESSLRIRTGRGGGIIDTLHDTIYTVHVCGMFLTRGGLCVGSWAVAGGVVSAERAVRAAAAAAAAAHTSSKSACVAGMHWHPAVGLEGGAIAATFACAAHLYFRFYGA